MTKEEKIALAFMLGWQHNWIRADDIREERDRLTCFVRSQLSDKAYERWSCSDWRGDEHEAIDFVNIYLEDTEAMG